MSGDVWVALAVTRPSVSDGFGDGWRHLGRTITGSGTTKSGEALLSKLLNGLGPRLSTLAFYIEADPSSAVAQNMLQPEMRFWLGFDVFGDGSRILTTRLPARHGVSRFRPPEPRPGLLNPGQPICLRIDADDEGLFDLSKS